ncbi:hypothetical protein H4R33_005406 [Dimargaris cristalligena]|uniref:Uncharacterized protein n=1 Tax=Dimargaris cristalligena TaxID=215637 RepID=A0A4P9ZYB1_9FUNG|nr:hypothetical protein H4R33_005406 [Dimargaris cristalligena]RKP37760.1 hypothetical protein BJ085DRAFT_41392 [Dimargaris cristalligena]|eukprot:RKP37760.1 hypothetical protein BJ085DRAFT_41392 [Dimargaris cristalligena]
MLWNADWAPHLFNLDAAVANAALTGSARLSTPIRFATAAVTPNTAHPATSSSTRYAPLASPAFHYHPRQPGGGESNGENAPLRRTPQQPFPANGSRHLNCGVEVAMDHLQFGL